MKNTPYRFRNARGLKSARYRRTSPRAKAPTKIRKKDLYSAAIPKQKPQSSVFRTVVESARNMMTRGRNRKSVSGAFVRKGRPCWMVERNPR